MTDDLIYRQILHPEKRLRRAELCPCPDHQGPDYPGHQVLELTSEPNGNVTAMCVEPPDVRLLQETFSPGTSDRDDADAVIARLRYGLAHAVWTATARRNQTVRDKATGQAYAYGKSLEIILRKLGQPDGWLPWRQPEHELPLPDGAMAVRLLGQETP
jgi:hypothetical protein